MQRHNFPYGTITRRCVVCRRLEIPEAGWIVRSFWFCPDCAAKIELEFRNRKEAKRIEVNSAAENS